MALTDISLIQLEKRHFITQIKTPSIRFVDHEAIPGVPGNGSVLLDVRLPHHFENQNLDGSANIPLLSLRLRLAEIPKDKQIIVVCEDGKASEAGAFLLNKYKCNAVVLKDGMGIEKPDGEPIPQEPVEAQQDITQTDNSSDIVIPEPSGESINADLDTLRADYEKLAQRNRELEEKNAALQAEKDQAENQCQLLTQQLERLKEILGRLTKRQ
jgi:rhodanese-related sulfurtransferase